MANTFDWVEIRTGDIERTARFYERLFSWQVVHRDTTEGTDYWIFDTGAEPRLQNIRRGGMWLQTGGRGLGVVVYVVVRDIEAILAQAQELGGAVVVPRTRQGPAFRACFRDPDGNLLGLWEEEGLE